jgi:hypothetical protein
MLNALMPARYQPPNPGRDERPRTVEAPQVFTLAPDHAGIETFNDTSSRVGRRRHNLARDGPREDDESPRPYGGPMASVKQIQVTFDCAEPERVARFWCEVLGYVAPPPPEGFATWDDFNRTLPPEEQGSWFACTDPTGVGPRLFFQRVPEGKVVKNRLHLDVRVGTGLVGEERLAVLEAECARLIPLGAVRVRLLPADDDNESCLVMQDIEGNEFCLD